jgi:DnaJ-class molecular chaperone
MAMTSNIAYNTLGLEQGASRNDIRKAYRHLALKYHPDKAKGGGTKKRADDQFRKIQRA